MLLSMEDESEVHRCNLPEKRWGQVPKNSYLYTDEGNTKSCAVYKPVWLSFFRIQVGVWIMTIRMRLQI